MDSFVFLSCSTVGASHRRNDAVCQDSAVASGFTTCSGKPGIVLAVADGHGDSVHNRSDIGAQFATEIAVKYAPSIIDNLGATRVNSSVLSFGARQQRDSCGFDAVELIARSLLCELNRQWCLRVLDHYRTFPLKDLDKSAQPPARLYGTTLLCAVMTDDFWFAYQLGDGAVIAPAQDTLSLLPVPADSRCRGNLTTSMSSCSADDFRFCLGRKVPSLLMLTTDGICGCYRDAEEMSVEFILPIMDALAETGKEKLLSDMPELLSTLSYTGAGDDMSCALWVDTRELQSLRRSLTSDSRIYHNSGLEECRKRLDELSGSLQTALKREREIEDEINLMRERFAAMLREVRGRLINSRAVTNTIQREIAEAKQEFCYHERRLRDNNADL